MSYTCIENKMKMDSSFYYLCVYILSCITIVIKENILAIIIIIIIIINQQVYIFIFILFLLVEEVTSWIIKYI
jgi:hypothetical protein